MQAAFPLNELAKLAALQEFQIVATPPEVAFDRIVHLARRVLHVPMAESAVTLGAGLKPERSIPGMVSGHNLAPRARMSGRATSRKHNRHFNAFYPEKRSGVRAVRRRTLTGLRVEVGRNSRTTVQSVKAESGSHKPKQRRVKRL